MPIREILLASLTACIIVLPLTSLIGSVLQSRPLLRASIRYLIAIVTVLSAMALSGIASFSVGFLLTGWNVNAPFLCGIISPWVAAAIGTLNLWYILRNDKH